MSKYVGVTERNKVLPEAYDEYLEAIYRISLHNPKIPVKNIEVSKFLKVQPSSVSKMLAKLSAQKYINWKPRGDGIKLTAKGKARAVKIITSNKISELFLSKVLGIEDIDEIEKISCQFEHYYSEALIRGFMKLMGITNKDVEKYQNPIIEDSLPEEKKLDIKPVFTQQEVRILLKQILEKDTFMEAAHFVKKLLKKKDLKE